MDEQKLNAKLQEIKTISDCQTDSIAVLAGQMANLMAKLEVVLSTQRHILAHFKMDKEQVKDLCDAQYLAAYKVTLGQLETELGQIGQHVRKTPLPPILPGENRLN